MEPPEPLPVDPAFKVPDGVMVPALIAEIWPPPVKPVAVKTAGPVIVPNALRSDKLILPP